MVSLESKAAWESRARAIGVPEGFISELKDASLDTFGQWAFCCASDPSSADDTPVKEAVQTLIGREVTPPEMIYCRKLFFEGKTYAVSDMQARIDRSADDKPRVMPLAERMARIERQKSTLVGVTWTAELEPAHKLVDKILTMKEDGTLVFIPPQKCISRIQEIQQEKHEVVLTFDAAGNVKMGKRAEELKCDTNGDLNLRNAWTRRNLAFDQAGLASLVVLEKWATKLMLAKLKEPPSGYRYISTQQICECDKEFWMLLSQTSRGSLQSLHPDVYPLDNLIEQLTTSPEVLCFLSPLPSQKREATESPATPAPKKPKPAAEASGGAPKAPAAPSGTNWRKLPQGCQRKGQNGWRCLKYQWDFATSRKRASASLGSTSASSAGQSGHITNVSTDKGLQHISHTSHVKRHSWNFSLVQVVYLMP